MQQTKQRKSSASKLTPSQLVKQQLTGNGFFEQALEKPRIIEFLNLADYSINTESYVNIDEPLFQAVPPVIQFSDYQPLQIKEKVFKLRNKDRFSRRVKIIQPDSKLFQVLIPNDTKTKLESGTKVAAGMETKFVIRFSPQAKIDYKYELIVVTEREKFIVPIVAVGKRAMIDFPDLLDFGGCPVKFSTQKPVIIRNLGEKTTKWNLELPAGFSTNQKEGVLEPGKNEQILLKFYPLEAKLYRTYAKLQYDKLQAYVELVGSGQLSNVYLSKPFVSMQQSYIGLQSQQTLHIINKSNVKVNFEWRAFLSEKEEKPKKELLYHQLQEDQAEELMLLREVINSQEQKEEDLQDINDSSSEEEVDPREYLERKRKRAELGLARKYKTIKKAIEDDLFLFQDTTFKIEPLMGQIWPNSEITITVTFMPIESKTYECGAFCNVSCAEQRLPLKLKGEGLGPKAYLTQQEINFGDIFVNQPIRQTVQIENRGEIPCRFELIKPERAFAKMFNFSIDGKTLDVGQNCSIQINFKSSIPGQFKQKFKWKLHGSQRHLQMTFLGHVIAPTFQFVDPNDTLKAKPEISFGKISYDFDYKEFITLKNTSSVEFNYNLKIQSDSKILQNEFRINPQSGTIPEKSQRLIEIQFTPKSVKKYETVMTIDIEGVGNDMLSIPIKADCQVPLVDITPAQKVQFAEACLNYPQTKSIILNNHSDIKAKFNIIPQSEQSKVLAKYTVSPESGVIDEKSSKELQITLITSKLGEITLPLHVNIIGTNNNQPHLLNICANSDGPKVAVTPEELDFGQVEVLKDYFQKVTIVNNSKIKAQFHAFTRQKISIFKPKIKHAFLEPGERLEFDVVCNADDSSKFNDILHFVVKDGKDKDVVLKARGVGSTIYCDDNLESLNFGTIYTYKTAVKEIFIQNRGRKAQKISWQRKKLLDKKKNKDEKQPEEETVFSIDPETETIPPKYGRYFRFVAISQKKGKIMEEFNLLSQVGNERKANQLKTMAIQGEFTQPNLIYSEKKLNFKYVWEVADKDRKVLPLEKSLELTSGSSLPLDFVLKVSPPFSVSEDTHYLQPGASTKIKVQFDPNYKVDKVSGILNGKINVVFADHPYRETVQLIGEVCFPNLKLQANLINFGAILNDTTKKISMLMKNVSEMTVTYEWAFLEEEILGEEEKMNLSSTSQFISGSIPINQVFDILPLSGKLDPGQVEEVEFIYNAQGGILYRTTALCHVEGGPNYEVKLQGDSSMISGKISDKELDFGVLKFCDWSSKELYIENTGKVTFEFKVSVADVKRKAFLEISPMNGKIAGGQKQKITVRICPTMPEIFTEQFEIQMGYYDPQKIVIKGQGVYPSLLCQFPRSENAEFDLKLKQQVDKYTKQYESYHRKMSKDKSKKKDKEMKTIEQFRHEIQKQMDRKNYCKLISQAIETYQKPQKPPNNNIQTKLFQKIYLTNWICDFGNVIVGSTQRKQLKFKNVGDQPIEMFFDLKPIKNSEYNITPDKSKLAPGEEVNVVVTLATKKNSKFGKLRTAVVLEVKNGAKYRVQLISNLTIPEIVVQGVVEGVLDFGKVLCGQRKAITLRFLNLKEIPCQWSLTLKEPITSPGEKDKDNEVKYELKPSSGKIMPGGFQMVKVFFTPSQQKQYLNKFPIKIQENPKILNLELKGSGTCITLDVKQQKLKIGPVLPYDNKAFALLEISNPTQYPTELINLDFDKKFREDIETLTVYQEIKNGGNQIQKRVVFLPTREAGAGLWPEVINAVAKKAKTDQLKKKLEATADETQKQALQKQIDTLNTVIPQIQYPRRVDTDKILHLIVTGPPQSGKTHIANTIGQLHKRAVIKMDEVVEWVLGSGSELAGKIKKFLEERRKEYELAVQEREKAFKKAGKKAKQLQEKLGPAHEAFYQHLPQHLWIECIKQRVKHPECGAGCIFDNLKSKHLPNNELLMISLIMKAIGNEAISIIDLDGIVKDSPAQQNQDARSEYNKKSETSEVQGMTSKGFGNTIPEIDKEEEEQIKFEVKDFANEEQSKKYQEKRSNLHKLFRNEYEAPLEIAMFRDPVFEDKKEPVVDEAQKIPRHLGTRDTIPFPIYCNSTDQRNSVKKLVPAPQYNDPMKEPLPEPEFNQVISKHSGKFFQSKILKQFQIFTPKEKYIPFKKPEKKDDKKDKRGDKKGKTTKLEAQPQGPVVAEVNPEELSKDLTRWVIPPETTLKLYVKFFTKLQGTFESLLTFENTFNLKKTQVPVLAKTEFPTLSNVPKTLFWGLKKSRPTTSPECYLSKVFVLQENCFDFGPLLIGKNVEKKNQKDIISVNSTTFKLVNIGHYPAEIEIALLSSIMEHEPGYKKGVFTVDFDKCVIQPDDPPKQLRVWSIPDEPKAFIDQLIIMIKNNPTPITIPLRCLGSKPIIEIKEGSPIKFTRILLNQSIKRELKLHNTSAIPIKFRLEGCEKLPPEFHVMLKQGKLKPNEQISIDVNFKAIKQQKFNQSLKLISEDTENLSILSNPIDIPIEAEAFDISVDLKFPNENTENLLDFGAIRVGDFKDQTFTVKNIGLYVVKISFNMKKKLYKDCFRIEPMQFELEPNNTKEVLVRFSSLKQVKLKTNNNSTDILMEILEGKTLETHRSVPINVSVNSVFSNYSIVPLKNMNFGPIQFNESKSRIFQVKNQGLFEFNFSIFDYANEEFRKELLENLEKDRQAKLEAANTLPAPGGGAADKKGSKKETKDVKKDSKKAGKGGKGQPQNSLKIGQWTITPATGTVGPDSSVAVEVKFTGNGQKLFQQKIAVDIENRNPNDEPNGILYELVAESCIPGINTRNFESIFEEQLVLPSQHHSTNVTTLVKSNVFFVQERVFNFGTLVPSKVPQGIIEKIKIENSNKVTCNVKFNVGKKTPNAIEQFAFEVDPKEIKIPPHQFHYVKIIFKPTIMASYAGIFEAVVENGDQEPKTHKLTFDLKGEGALPTLRVEKPKEYLDQKTILLKFPKTRVGKISTQQISLKNDGSIPATAKFDLIPSDSFRFVDNATVSLNPKTYSIFNIQFKPLEVGVKNWDITATTLLNQFQTMRFKIQGQAYFEDILFENLPYEEEDKINFDDCVIGQEKRITFSLRNNGTSTVKFNWNAHEDFKFIPNTGHIAGKSLKSITVAFKSSKTIMHKELPIPCETVQIKQNSEEYHDWDDSMTVKKFVTKSVFEWIQKKKEEERKRKEEEAEAAKKGGKKDPKKAPKKEDKKEEEEKMPEPKQGQQADIMIEEVIKEPEHAIVQKTQKSLTLKASAVADYSKYEIQSRKIDFLPTMMYTSRVHKFNLKNTSTTKMLYNCKIVSAETGKIDAGFFTVSPHSGTVMPGCDQVFTVKFSPTEVEDNNDRLLVMGIKNLDPGLEKLIIELNGDTERPICHFEIPPSKYREKKPDIQAKYNIIQFQSLGTKVKNTKRFYVVNPTSLAYDYEWKKIDDTKDSNSGFFRCSTSKGTILSGKKAQMIFEYTPDLLGTHESYWVFQIPSQKIVQYFLLVGDVVEPNIFFDIGKINFGPLLLGGKNREMVSLKNLEEVPLAFNFDKESIRGDLDSGASLKVQPMSGVVPSGGETKIEVIFQPRISKQFNYNIACNVTRRSRPICVNVKGIGYVLSHSVHINDRPNALNKSQKTEINFGNIFVNESKTKSLTIENKGDFNFDFAIKSNSPYQFLNISKEFGTVRKNEKFVIDLEFAPKDQFAFKSNSFLTLSIISGPTYTFQLRGTAKKPGVDFSFFNYDFGPCFVLKQPLSITTYLEVRNRENTAMTIESLFEKTDYLDVKIPSGEVVLPLEIASVKNKKGVVEKVEKNVLKIPIVFTPREMIKYQDTLTFDINSLNKIHVKIKGQGIPLKLQVEKTEDQNVDFGITKVGQDDTRIIGIVNNSKKKIQITFNVDQQLQQLKKMFINVNVSPTQTIIINPREKYDLELSFKPTMRISPFKAELMYKIVDNQEKKKLLNIFTTAHGIEMKLMEDTVGFGTVVINSKITKTIQLSNFGDIPSKFEWDTKFCGKYFTISPEKGHLNAHEDILFDVTFHPNVVDNDIKFKVKCSVDGMDPLFVNLIGKCIPQPNDTIQEIKFQCMVRKEAVQKITLKNPTPKPWKIKASISSNEKYNYFSGNDFVQVPANGQTDYEVKYLPLTMTANDQQPNIKETSHNASLFFPIPDGTALMYKLIGKSTPPQVLQTYDLTTKAKKNLIHLIQIKNWLAVPQRFNVSWKFDVEDKTVFINAANTFDVAGDSVKDYKLSVYALKACASKFTLFFKNPNTHEFISFRVNLTVTPGDAMDVIELSSLVRETTHKLITLENPLPHPVQIKKEMLVVESDVVFLSPNAFTIPAKSEFGFEIIYRPLLAKEQNSKIIIKSPDLGEFTYPLKLTGQPSTSDRVMNFKAALGGQITQKFKFIHYGKKQSTYTCRVEKLGQKTQQQVDPKAKVPVAVSDFTVETPTVNVVGSENFQGTEASVNIKFEPSGMGESVSQLIISSPDGGEYVTTLNGSSTVPQPKGPYKISAKPPPIDFKNPFFEPYEFIVRIDNPAFTSTVKSPVKVDGKKVLSINLAYKAVQGFSANGRLTISAGENLVWVFYLQGE